MLATQCDTLKGVYDNFIAGYAIHECMMFVQYLQPYRQSQVDHHHRADPENRKQIKVSQLVHNSDSTHTHKLSK